MRAFSAPAMARNVVAPGMWRRRHTDVSASGIRRAAHGSRTADFVDTGEGLQNLSENSLYISSGVSVPTSITSLAPGEAATFFFGTGLVDKYDNIAFSFDAYSSPSLLPSTYLGGMGFADNAVPEPSTWAMLVLGFAGLGYASHRAHSRLLIA